MKKHINHILKSLKLPLFLLFISFFNKSFSQCTIYHENILENHTKQCQACYIKLKYYYMTTKVYWGNCATKNAYLKKVDCMNKIYKAATYLNLIGTDEILRIEELAKSKCTETRGGQHLWKEINLKSEVLMDYRKVNNLKDNYWCALLEQNYTLESLMGINLMIYKIEYLNDL
jgi:hypothetical protein